MQTIILSLLDTTTLEPDYLFPGIPRLGSLAIITGDLRGYDTGMELFDKLDELQQLEEEFLKKLYKLVHKFRSLVAVLTVGGEVSRGRFMKLQQK